MAPQSKAGFEILKLRGMPSPRQTELFIQTARNKSKTVYQLVFDFSELRQLPHSAKFALGNFIDRLLSRRRKIAVIHAEALGEKFAESHPDGRFFRSIYTLGEAKEFFSRSVLRVLAVEDDPVTGQLILEYLRGKNAETRLAESAEEGIQMAREQPPDIILMDYHLPAMDGPEAVRQIRSDPKTRGIPIIMLTSEAGRDKVREAVASKVDGYVLKPFDHNSFFDKILQALGD